MDLGFIAGFADEMSKIAESAKANVAESSLAWKGTNISAPSLLPKSNTPPSLSSTKAKNTNYSIVNTQAPAAAFGSASATSKAVPPPPVRT